MEWTFSSCFDLNALKSTRHTALEDRQETRQLQQIQLQLQSWTLTRRAAPPKRAAGRQDEPRVARNDAFHGLWCHRVRARLLRLLQALEAKRPQVRSGQWLRGALSCGAVPRRGGGGVLGGEREGDCGAGDGVWGISDKAGSRAGSPPGPTSTLRQAHLNGAARSLVVQMCITATVSMWLMCVQPPTPQEAARPARPPPCHRHSRPLCFWLPCNGLALPPASD